MGSYSKSGVDYTKLDPVKMLGQKMGLFTSKNILDTKVKELKESRGETAYVLEDKECFYALVQEGLGTKNLVADEMRKITGKTYYDAIAKDTVAAIVNDMITVGARPLSVLAYWAVGNSSWWDDEKRTNDLVLGWKKACDLSGVSWGGGETSSMSGVISPNVINLAGSSFGIIKPKSRLITGEKLSEGDAIILLESNGIHANGLSLARKIAKNSSAGYAKVLTNGKMYGEELLRPSITYAKLVESLILSGIDIHYMVNISGHGWKKLMRQQKDFVYFIHSVPEIPTLFTYIQKMEEMSFFDMYGTFNMGAGFALILDKKSVREVLNQSKKYKIKAYEAGFLKKGNKQVVINPYNIVYRKSSLKVRI